MDNVDSHEFEYRRITISSVRGLESGECSVGQEGNV